MMNALEPRKIVPSDDWDSHQSFAGDVGVPGTHEWPFQILRLPREDLWHKTSAGAGHQDLPLKHLWHRTEIHSESMTSLTLE